MPKNRKGGTPNNNGIDPAPQRLEYELKADDQIMNSLKQWLGRATPAKSTNNIMELSMALATDLGTSRSENQDRACALKIHQSSNKATTIAVLCDGMGGMSDGAHCAELAISTFLASCIRNRREPSKKRMYTAALDANDIVYQKYEGRGGTTLSAVILESDGSFMGINVGDSRIYGQETDSIKQLSVDDTIAGQLSTTARIDTDFRGDLLQFIGMGADLEPHIIEISNAGKFFRLVLTSDGVHHIAKQTLENILQHASDSAQAASRLTDIANWCGGKDNGTSIVIDTSKLLNKDNHHTIYGNLVFWDPFNSTHIVGLEPQRPAPAPAPAQADSNTDKKVDNNLVNAKEKETKKKTPKKKQAPKKGKKPEPPQLDIEFKK